jgi:iron complex transport system ATP-binding protein
MTSSRAESVVLSIARLVFRYPAGAEDVLADITLDVAGGEVVALAGPNGCGKTTLLRAAAGMLSPRSGSVSISRATGPVHRLGPEKRARLIAVVPQFAKLPAGFSVHDAVMTGRISFHGWFGPESAADRAAVRRALESVGMDPAEGQDVGTLSGGAVQRVLIARALAQEAPVLLMDEPTAHLDLRYQVETLALLKRFAREAGRAVLVAMHDLNLAGRFADRVALMERGRRAACGRPADVLTRERLSPLYCIPMTVIPHPLHGYPIVIPDGEERRGEEPCRG